MLHFLSSFVPITKTYEKHQNGSIKVTSYPNVYEVTSHSEPLGTISDFEKALQKHAFQGHCLSKGVLNKPLVNISRAGSTNTNDTTGWICFDIDGLTLTVEEFLAAIKLDDISYIVQYSASHKIIDLLLHAHIFMLLDKPIAAPLLKQWLINLNLRTPELYSALKLTKTGNSLHWGLDISACQNDKLLYIAPPTIIGFSDPVPKRIELITKKHDVISFTYPVPSIIKNREQSFIRIDELRELEGLPKRKTSFKMVGSMEVMIKPDACTISGFKQERNFNYFNLNNGDSWGYYHPDNNPDYIHNFKGEPIYLTKELLPEYWADLTSTGSRIGTDGLLYLSFCDRATSTYWRGTYSQSTDVLQIFLATTETQLRDFSKQHGIPVSDYVPEWDIIFDPNSTIRVDIGRKIINIFTPTEYMKAVPVFTSSCPPTILKIITHALGGELLTVEHFINWLAFILQKKDKTKTAWVLHGTQGTGKGILMNKVLRPLLGLAQTAIRRMEELDERYNTYMKGTLLLFIDEIQTKALINERSIIAKFKNFITEDWISIRAMFSNAIEVRNYTNVIMASNMPDPVTIDKEDRRFNVGGYQPVKLDITDAEIDGLTAEIQQFHDFLFFYKLNEAKASTVLESIHRSTLISISESSIDTVASALLEGNFEFFIDQLPTNNLHENNVLEQLKVSTYKEVLIDLFNRTNRTTGICKIMREELRVLFDYTVGVSKAAATPNKFTSLLKHHRIHIGKVRIGDKIINGVQTTWKDTTTSTWANTLIQTNAVTGKLIKIK